MNKTIWRFTISLVFLTGMLCATATAQDFSKSYRLQSGGKITVKNVSGDVIVNGYDGDTIKVTGIKEGRDKDVVEVVDQSDASQIDLSVHYPRNCDCDASIR